MSSVARGSSLCSASGMHSKQALHSAEVSERVDESLREMQNRRKLILKNVDPDVKEEGYGFVEFMKRDGASRAHAALMGEKTPVSVAGSLQIQISWADTTTLSEENQHSSCLLLSPLPPSLRTPMALTSLFPADNTPTYCQAAEVCGKGLAVAEFPTWQLAEKAWTSLGSGELFRVFCKPDGGNKRSSGDIGPGVGVDLMAAFCCPGVPGPSCLAAVIAAQSKRGPSILPLLPDPIPTPPDLSIGLGDTPKALASCGPLSPAVVTTLLQAALQSPHLLANPAWLQSVLKSGQPVTSPTLPGQPNDKPGLLGEPPQHLQHPHRPLLPADMLRETALTERIGWREIEEEDDRATWRRAGLLGDGEGRWGSDVDARWGRDVDGRWGRDGETMLGRERVGIWGEEGEGKWHSGGQRWGRHQEESLGRGEGERWNAGGGGVGVSGGGGGGGGGDASWRRWNQESWVRDGERWVRASEDSLDREGRWLRRDEGLTLSGMRADTWGRVLSNESWDKGGNGVWDSGVSEACRRAGRSTWPASLRHQQEHFEDPLQQLRNVFPDLPRLPVGTDIQCLPQEAKPGLLGAPPGPPLLPAIQDEWRSGVEWRNDEWFNKVCCLLPSLFIYFSFLLDLYLGTCLSLFSTQSIFWFI
uniref:Ribonucleoprotein, PTB-binding 1 n=1 Tax=Eptatretus burgeri TaxID=7764 RepID=A0A8C4NB26_EPTBU